MDSDGKTPDQLSDKHKKIVENSEDRMKILRGEGEGSSKSRRRRRKAKEASKEPQQDEEASKKTGEPSNEEAKVQVEEKGEEKKETKEEKKNEEKKKESTVDSTESGVSGIPERRVIKSRRKKKQTGQEDGEKDAVQLSEAELKQARKSIQVRWFWNSQLLFQAFLAILTALLIEFAILNSRHTPLVEMNPSSLVELHFDSSSVVLTPFLQRGYAMLTGEDISLFDSKDMFLEEAWSLGEGKDKLSEYFLQPHDPLSSPSSSSSSLFSLFDVLPFASFLSLPLFTVLIFLLSKNVSKPKQAVSKSELSAGSGMLALLVQKPLAFLFKVPTQLCGIFSMLILSLILLPLVLQFPIHFLQGLWEA